MSSVERERDRYRLAAEAAQVELRRVSQERDQLREHFEALSIKDNGKVSLTSSSSVQGFPQKFSSAGPHRRKSTSLSTFRSPWATAWFNSQPRCKSADPWLSGRRGVNDCFDVTISAPALLPQPSSPGKYPDPYLIRDASRPNEGPRVCYPYNKPGEIKLDHIDILYAPYDGRLYCRACQWVPSFSVFIFFALTPNVSVNKVKSKGAHDVEIKIFANNASWDQLRDHWLTEHQKENEDVARLSVAEINEFRRRLREKQSSSWCILRYYRPFSSWWLHSHLYITHPSYLGSTFFCISTYYDLCYDMLICTPKDASSDFLLEFFFSWGREANWKSNIYITGRSGHSSALLLKVCTSINHLIVSGKTFLWLAIICESIGSGSTLILSNNSSPTSVLQIQYSGTYRPK
jgi:hypothetical protein